MSLGIDPLISNIFFSLGLIPHVAYTNKPKNTEYLEEKLTLPFVTVIIALYKEKREDINSTISSLLAQSYPKNRYEILFALEPDDKMVIDIVYAWIEKLGKVGIRTKIVYSDGKLRTKPHALNQAIKQATGEYCVFYDASDEIDCDQIEKAISLMTNKNFDVVQAKVLRKSKSLLGRFLLLDTIIWYWKYIPILLRFCGGFPLSGEGLFIKKSVLCEIGCFPEVLTEDALLGLILTEKNKRFGIIDSNIVEKAPKNVRSHFRQKLRWNRGYLTCLKRLLFSKMPLRKKGFFLLPFFIPITSSLAFLGWLLIMFILIANFFLDNPSVNFQLVENSVYNNILHHWSLFLAYVGMPLVVLSTIHAAWCAKMLRYTPISLLLPFYWIFVGFCSLCSFFRGTNDWGKTER